MKKELIRIKNTDYWMIVVGMLQQNWAVIEASDNGVTLFFFNDLGGVFDQIDFKSKEEAEAALLLNGFKNYDEDPKIKTFVPKAKHPSKKQKHRRGLIYSSGEYWK